METPSPYSPPSELGNSSLSRFQKACLRNILKRHQNPSKVRYVLRQWPVVIGYAVICFAMFGFVYATVSDLAVIYLSGAFSFGFFVASLAITLGECIRHFRVWPAMNRVIDWEELQRLAE